MSSRKNSYSGGSEQVVEVGFGDVPEFVAEAATK